MDEAPLELVERFLLLIDRRECRQVEVALVTQAHDTEIIHFVPCATIENTVSEGEESMILPTELGNGFCRFGSFIEELFEACQLFLFCQPDIVADGLYLLLEAAQTDQIFRLELDDTFLAIFVLNLE